MRPFNYVNALRKEGEGERQREDKTDIEDWEREFEGLFKTRKICIYSDGLEASLREQFYK